MKHIYLLLVGGLIITTTALHAQNMTMTGPKTMYNIFAPSSGYTFVSLQRGEVVAIGDTAQGWDLAMKGTTILFNSGTSGSGTVQAQLLTASPFSATVALPTGGYVSDNGTTRALMTGSGNGWYYYTFSNPVPGVAEHVIYAIPERTIAINFGNGKYAKLQILNYYRNAPVQTTIDPNIATGNYYSLRYDISEDGTFGEAVTRVANLNAAGTTYTLFDLATGQVVATEDSLSLGWDMGFKGTTIVTNSGTSGSGTAQSQVVATAFSELTAAPSAGYLSDNNQTPAYAIPTGSGNGWYNYVGPPSHLITPIEGRTIVVKDRMGRYVKVMIESYYLDANTANASRYYTFSYYYQAEGTTDLSVPQEGTTSVPSTMEEALSAFTLMPNPTQGDDAMIVLHYGYLNTITVTDLNGREVATLQTTESKVNLAPFVSEKGMYLVRCTGGGTSYTQKLMVQ